MIYAASPWAVLLSEHRTVACVPSGHSVRCDLRMFQRSETTLGAQTESGFVEKVLVLSVVMYK